jgi:hypothetical protein
VVPGTAVPDLSSAPVVVRAGSATIVAAEPVEVCRRSGAGAFAALDDLTPGWWAGYLSYDLGRSVERVRPRLPDDLGLPDLVLARYEARATVDEAGTRFDGPRRAVASLQRLLERAPAVAETRRRSGPRSRAWIATSSRPACERSSR